MTVPQRRFDVALSFPGERRDFVKGVADSLAATFGHERILYDHYHEAEFACLDLNVYLPNLYVTQSELIAIFLCKEYKAKRWCRLEWRFIRQLIATTDAHRIMFLSFDEIGAAPEIGILEGDGYVLIGTRTPQEIAALIVHRLKLNSQCAVLAGSTVTDGTASPTKNASDNAAGVAAGASIGTHEQVFDLETGWSDAHNPNGPWSYNDGNGPISVPCDAYFPTEYRKAQPAWAYAPEGAGHIVSWFKSVNTLHDFQVGDVVTHTWDGGHGTRSIPHSNVTWTAPTDGYVSISGGVWMVRKRGQMVEWSLHAKGKAIARGSIFDGDEYSRESIFTFAAGETQPGALERIPVAAGDKVTLMLKTRRGTGELVGVRLSVVLSAESAGSTDRTDEDKRFLTISTDAITARVDTQKADLHSVGPLLAAANAASPQGNRKTDGGTESLTRLANALLDYARTYRANPGQEGSGSVRRATIRALDEAAACLTDLYRCFHEHGALFPDTEDVLRDIGHWKAIPVSQRTAVALGEPGTGDVASQVAHWFVTAHPPVEDAERAGNFFVQQVRRWAALPPVGTASMMAMQDLGMGSPKTIRAIPECLVPMSLARVRELIEEGQCQRKKMRAWFAGQAFTKEMKDSYEGWIADGAECLRGKALADWHVLLIPLDAAPPTEWSTDCERRMRILTDVLAALHPS